MTRVLTENILRFWMLVSRYGRRTERDLDILTYTIQYAFQEQELKVCVNMLRNFRQTNFLFPIMSYISAKSEVIASISYRNR